MTLGKEESWVAETHGKARLHEILGSHNTNTMIGSPYVQGFGLHLLLLLLLLLPMYCAVNHPGQGQL